MFEHFPAGRAAVNAIHLVETSNAMQRMQEERLQSTAKKYGWDVQWHSSLQDVAHDTQVYTMVLAHEFFDALPFHLLEVMFPTFREFLYVCIDRHCLRKQRKGGTRFSSLPSQIRQHQEY